MNSMPDKLISRVPMRVLHLNSMLKGGGTDDQCVKLVAALAQLGQPVGICGPDGRDYSRVIRTLGVPFYPTPPEGLAKWRFILSAVQSIRREGAQIVHGHHGRDIWPTVLAARLSGVRPKIVLTRHMAKSPASWVSQRHLLSQCDALFAVSEFVAKVLREGHYEPESPEPERRARLPIVGDFSKIEVIYGGIDTERFRPLDATAQRAAWGLAPEHFAFAVMGAYDHPRGKGQREFLQAAAKIRAEAPNARFIIVGRGSLAETLRGDIARLGLADVASLPPYCHDMPAAMNAIDCLVHPATGTEAFGAVVLEAMACGKPVIASALDGIPEAFAAGGFGQLVKPESADELAAAMRAWAGRPALSPAESAALHRRVAEQFSVRAYAERVLAGYRRLLVLGAAFAV